MNLQTLGPSLIARLTSWVRAVVRRNRLEEEMEVELAHHLESLTADLIRAGQLPAEAARNARIALGAVAINKEEMRSSLGLRGWDELWADLRYGVRILQTTDSDKNWSIQGSSSPEGRSSNATRSSSSSKINSTTLGLDRRAGESMQ